MNHSNFAIVCRRCLIGLGAVLLGLIAASSCWAQSNNFGAPSIDRPTTSPYLNLFNGTNRSLSLGLNYQRRVRPEQALRQNAATTNNQVGALQQQLNLMVGPDGNVRLPGTGHRTSFMNTGGYFGGSAGFGGGSLLANRNPVRQNPLNQALNPNKAFNRNQGPAGATMLGRR